MIPVAVVCLPNGQVGDMEWKPQVRQIKDDIPVVTDLLRVLLPLARSDGVVAPC
jgi:hypothetical protein